MANNSISRRDFLKLSGAAAGGLILRPQPRALPPVLQDFPQADHLARAVGNTNVRALPDINSGIVDTLYEDEVVPWIREVVGEFPQAAVLRWVETPKGWVWSPNLQPVKNNPNEPITTLEPASVGPGMWVEVTVPYVEVRLANAQPAAPWLQTRMFTEYKPILLYYKQIFWVDEISQEGEQIFYRLVELYGSYGDMFIGPAEAFRRITPEEIAPISPEVENKIIQVNLQRQTVQAFEDGREVFFCRCSTGLDGEDTETPPGLYHQVWRKLMSVHMSGNIADGFDTPGIGYTTLFIGEGIAFHSTFWHNMYGAKRSHGCVNLRPEDAKWIWRWTTPYVPYDPGDMTVTDYSGTVVQVVEY
ncbi:MAG TPA: L,D-transpeptidase family protein [Anaerolineales bacterium]|nr:L,D-transpeptidase family protein [Anaerolineales bacterium]